MNTMKDKNYTVIATDAEAALERIKYSFMMSILSKLGIESSYFNIIWSHMKS